MAKITLIEYAQKHGAREAALVLVDKKLQSVCGLSRSDCPDTSALCDLYDSLEETIQAGLDGEEGVIDRAELSKHLDTIDEDFVYELVMG